MYAKRTPERERLNIYIYNLPNTNIVNKLNYSQVSL